MKQNRTRTALADAYMHLLNDYTIDRITVKMITDAVGCSRKTFYYYFTDVYVLTQYVFELRVQQFLDTNGNFETMREGFLTLAANLSNDRQAILNIYHGYGKEELERFTWETSDYYARQVITRYAQNMDIASEDLESIIRMYTDMMFGMLIDWINNAEVEWKGDFGHGAHAGAARQLPQRESGGGQRPVNRIKTPGSRERSGCFFRLQDHCSQNRISTVATSARVPVFRGARVVADVPAITPVPTAQAMAARAHVDTRA